MPQRALQLPFVRTYANVTPYVVGSAAAAYSSIASALGGFYTAPFRLPPDVDPSRPISVHALIATLANATINGQSVRFQLLCSRLTALGALSITTINYDWPVPTNWLITDFRTVLIDAGSGVTFPWGTFNADDWIGLAIARNGAAAQDTYNQTTALLAGLQLLYFRRCSDT